MVRDIGRKFKWKFYFSPILFFWKLFLLELFEEWTWMKPHTVFQLLLKRKARAASSRRASPSVHNQAPLPGFGMTFHWASSHKTSCESAGKPKHPVGLLGSSSLPLSDSQLESICASAFEARGWTQNEPRRTDRETGEAQSPAERSQQRLRAGWVWREGKRQGSIRARSEVRGRRPDATHAPEGKGGRAPAQITDKQWNLAAGGVVYHWKKQRRDANKQNTQVIPPWRGEGTKWWQVKVHSEKVGGNSRCKSHEENTIPVFLSLWKFTLGSGL